ncbi:MAG: DUF503 domain-containing protein [Nanoarchaeota archaeon]
MVVYCEMEIIIPMAQSLKEKRNLLKSLQNKLKNQFNIAISEIDKNEIWKSSVLGIVSVSKDRVYLEKITTDIINFVDQFYGVEISTYNIEYF